MVRKSQCHETKSRIRQVRGDFGGDFPWGALDWCGKILTGNHCFPSIFLGVPV